MSDDKKSFPSSVDFDEIQVSGPPRKTLWGAIKDDPAPFVGTN